MKPTFNADRAFSLVEVTLSLGVISFCLVALFGLLPIGLKSNRQAVEQTAANGIISAVAADLRATPQTVPAGLAAKSQQYAIDIPANPVTSSPPATVLYFTADGQFSTSLGSGSRYLLTVTFIGGGTSPKSATQANLRISWPAGATLANAEGSVQTFVALDRN